MIFDTIMFWPEEIDTRWEKKHSSNTEKIQKKDLSKKFYCGGMMMVGNQVTFWINDQDYTYPRQQVKIQEGMYIIPWGKGGFLKIKPEHTTFLPANRCLLGDQREKESLTYHPSPSSNRLLKSSRK